MAVDITLTGQEIFNLTHAWLDQCGMYNPEMAQKIEPLIGYAEHQPHGKFKIVIYREAEVT